MAVTGHAVQFWRLEAGDVTTPTPLTNAAVLAPSGSSFAVFPVTATGDGGFTAVNVPVGTYYFRLGTSYVVSQSNVLNLDDHGFLGRPGTAAAPPTLNVNVSLSNLSVPDLDVELVTPNVGGWQTMQSTVPVVNGRVNGQYVFDLSGGLPDGVLADQSYATLSEWTTATNALDGGTVDYRRCVQAVSLMGLSWQANPALPGVAFAPVTVRPTIDARFSEYVARATEVHPQAVFQYTGFSVFASPNPPGAPPVWAGYSGSLLDVWPTGSDDVVATVEYAMPYPSTWSNLASAWAAFTTPTRLVGTTSGGVPGSLNDNRATTAGTFRPRISPPRNLRVDGASATTPRTLAGLTPLIQWDPPTVGTPSGYTVAVFRLTASSTRTTRSTVATFFTRGTSVQVPPGVLSTTGTWAIRATAVLTPGKTFDDEPFAYFSAIDAATADAVSSILTTP